MALFLAFGKGGFLVGMRGFFLLAVLLSIVLGMPPAFAAASSNASGQNTSGQNASATNQPTARCGATVADALKEARQALAKPDAGSERAALACLIEATTDLDVHVHALDMGRAPSGMLHAIDIDHLPATNGK